jgi:hypothetical protein
MNKPYTVILGINGMAEHSGYFDVFFFSKITEEASGNVYLDFIVVE